MGRCVAGLIALGLVFTLVACWGEPDSGPEEIHWDRDVCELCRMLVSEPRFVAEVRGGANRRLYKFDDIGCAVNWLNGQSWAGEDSTEIWVAGPGSDRTAVNWLNAREARYVKGALTPMDYGFSAVPGNAAQGETNRSLSFEEMTNVILKNGANHICKTPQRAE